MQLDELEFLLIPSPYSYGWSFGDGATSTNQNPQHTYTANGTYAATLVVSDGLSQATNTVTVLLAPPLLGIAITADGQLSLTWPAWATNSTLYSTTNLNPPAAWAPVTNALTVVGDQAVLVLPMESVSRFFRLSR
jgi:PKD repeat protein